MQIHTGQLSTQEFIYAYLGQKVLLLVCWSLQLMKQILMQIVMHDGLPSEDLEII